MILKRPTENTIQDIIDKASVKELIEFERYCRDNAIWDEMKKCFHKDSTVTISWFQGSGWDFVEESSKMKERAPHKIYNSEIWVNNDKAVAIMLVTIEKRFELDGAPVDLKSDAKLVYRTERMDGLWYIDSFQAIYEQDSIVPVYPNGQIHLDMEELAKFRDSYACLSYSLRRSGYEINNDLPGIDRPELVERLYQDAKEWLEK